MKLFFREWWCWFRHRHTWAYDTDAPGYRRICMKCDRCESAYLINTGMTKVWAREGNYPKC